MTRILITAAAGCILTGGIGYLLLPVLRALKAGQSIREIGPTWHNSKAGTPMMGGLMFIFGTILCLVGNFPAMSDDSPFYVLALALCFGLIGFLDDFTKVKFHRNLGLTTLQKAMLQMAVSALFLYAMYRSGFMDTHLYIPFANVSFQLHPIVYIFFAMFVMVGTDNAVNLTDGVDGLSASLAVVTIGTYLIAYHEELADYSTAGVVFMGALLAYLWSNAKPSTLLMGDAGSRAMGFFIAILSLKCGHPFAFLLAAIVFIVDGSLGILKISLKRFLHISILKNTRTPLHDHVRKNKGWSDEQVVARWLILQCVASALLLLVVHG